MLSDPAHARVMDACPAGPLNGSIPPEVRADIEAYDKLRLAAAECPRCAAIDQRRPSAEHNICTLWMSPEQTNLLVRASAALGHVTAEKVLEAGCKAILKEDGE